MKYEIKWSDTAVKQLQKLEKKTIRSIINKVEKTSGNPFRFVKKLRGLDLYSLRIGHYRVILKIEGRKMVIFVVEVGHRKKIYKSISR
jgi:mRNA interferase RelE/StbE